MVKSKDDTVLKSKIILVSSVGDCTKSNTKVDLAPSNIYKNKEERAEWLVAVDRKISLFEWIILLTAPIINPVIGIIMVSVGIRYFMQKKNCDSDKALKSKALILGLAQWAYRLSATIAILAICLIVMYKVGRFPAIWLFYNNEHIKKINWWSVFNLILFLIIFFDK